MRTRLGVLLLAATGITVWAAMTQPRPPEPLPGLTDEELFARDYFAAVQAIQEGRPFPDVVGPPTLNELDTFHLYLEYEIPRFEGLDFVRAGDDGLPWYRLRSDGDVILAHVDAFVSSGKPDDRRKPEKRAEFRLVAPPSPSPTQERLLGEVRERAGIVVLR